MRTLGEAVDFALCDQGLNPAELTAILSNSLEMRQFERGMPRVICGMSGDEFARENIGSKTPRHTALRAKPARPAPRLGLFGISARKHPGLRHRRSRLATDRSGVRLFPWLPLVAKSD